MCIRRHRLRGGQQCPIRASVRVPCVPWRGKDRYHSRGLKPDGLVRSCCQLQLTNCIVGLYKDISPPSDRVRQIARKVGCHGEGTAPHRRVPRRILALEGATTWHCHTARVARGEQSDVQSRVVCIDTEIANRFDADFDRYKGLPGVFSGGGRPAALVLQGSASTWPWQWRVARDRREVLGFSSCEGQDDRLREAPSLSGQRYLELYSGARACRRSNTRNKAAVGPTHAPSKTLIAPEANRR